ncbi:MAG: hypothetical protein WC989_08600 [Micavibrio sp.]
MRGQPTQLAAFDRLTDARKWAQDTESAIRDGRYFKYAEAKTGVAKRKTSIFEMKFHPSRNPETCLKNLRGSIPVIVMLSKANGGVNPMLCNCMDARKEWGHATKSSAGWSGIRTNAVR